MCQAQPLIMLKKKILLKIIDLLIWANSNKLIEIKLFKQTFKCLIKCQFYRNYIWIWKKDLIWWKRGISKDIIFLVCLIKCIWCFHFLMYYSNIFNSTWRLKTTEKSAVDMKWLFCYYPLVQVHVIIPSIAFDWEMLT